MGPGILVYLHSMDLPRPGLRSRFRSILGTCLLLLVLASLARVWPCWNCEGAGRIWLQQSYGQALQPCIRCDGRGRISLGLKLSHGPQKVGIAAPANPDREAAEILRKIEGQIGAARTIRLSFKRSVLGKDGAASELEGTLILKEGDRFLLRFTERSGSDPRPESVLAASDGKRMVEVRGPGGKESGSSEQATPEGLNRWISSALIHAGPYLYPRFLPQGGNPKEAHPVDWLTPAESDLPGARLLTFITLDSMNSGRGRLWYDPKTLTPLKCERVDRSGTRTVTDLYADVTLNADIPDETFTLPALK